MKIETPCHQNYKTMTPSKEGRFCRSCQKVVVDFRNMNEQQIKNYFQKSSSEHVCGRFKSAQLNEGNKVERFIWQLKERIQTKVGFTPFRVAFLSILTGLVTFTSSCMGAVQREYPNEEPKPDNKTGKVNLVTPSDSGKTVK
jgi:hypothetical protein